MADVFNVSERTELGSRHSKRLRQAGQVPAVLYGHGQANVHLAVPTDEVHAAIRHGAHLVDLSGAVSESALIREVHWDTFGLDVLHLDLTRVLASEKVEIQVNVELRGDAPGAKSGGIVKHMLHELLLECAAREIPDKLEVSINSLNVGESILASDVPLPSGAVLLSDAESVIVQCVEAAPDLEEEAVEGAAPAEPEIIGRKPDEEAEN